MATKRQRKDGSWEFVVKRSRMLPKPISMTFRVEAEGDAYVRRLEQLLDRGIVPDEFRTARRERATRLREVVLEYKGAVSLSAADSGYISVVLDRLQATLELRVVTFEWATGWVTSMKRDANLAPSTIRHHVGALARCLDWAVAHRKLPINPLRQLPKGYAQYSDADATAVATRKGGGEAKESTERDRRLAAGEEARIRAVLSGEKRADRQRALELKEKLALATLFDLALESAMRMSEMYTLEVGQVDFTKRTVFLERTKNGSKRQVPMTSVAKRVLKAMIGKRRSGLVFPWWNGDREAETMKRCTAQLSRQFARIFEAAGCADLRFHDLRHEATARLYERTTLTDLQIAKITGHKDIRSLARYANLRGSDLAARLW
ncbi:MAG TPA: site-specific integrase [Luteimonas sp.]|nr:site-specific integrase [Luteimonas sp.]